jgi:hypothetical protein
MKSGIGRLQRIKTLPEGTFRNGQKYLVLVMFISTAEFWMSEARIPRQLGIFLFDAS